MLILNKYILHIVLCLIVGVSWGQSPIENKWKQEQRQLEYRKGNKYNGPENWYGPSPAGIKEEQINFGPPTSGGNTIKYVPKQIRQDRQKRYEGFDRGGGTGDAKFEPRVKRPDPIEIDPIDIDTPDVDVPDIDTPSISPTFWNDEFELRLKNQSEFKNVHIIKSKAELRHFIQHHVKLKR